MSGVRTVQIACECRFNEAPFLVYTLHMDKTSTYVNHGIGGDAEQRSPLRHLTDLIPGLASHTQAVQFG